MQEIVNPYADLAGGEWIRGNLHTHTTASDGSRPIQDVVSDYEARGYGFLMVSDHDIYTGPNEHAGVTTGSLTLIPGNEITANGPHLLHVNGSRQIPPDPVRQNVFDAISADSGFAIVNHPNWLANFDHCPIDRMREWTGYTGLEIYNGTIGRLDGSPYATNKWDMLLSSGRRVWGFANDDSHLPERDVELGWNTVYVQDRSVEAIVDAMARGRFYASTGVTIDSIQVDGDTIRIVAPNAARIVALMQVGRRIAEVDGPSIEVRVPEDALYVRFECWGTGEAFAWTQPFFRGSVRSQ